MTAEQRAYKARSAREWRHRHGATPRPTRPYRFDDLLRVALSQVPAGASGTNLTGAAYKLLGVDRATARRWRSIGLDAFTADRLACRLGLHPASVLGPAWFDDEIAGGVEDAGAWSTAPEGWT